ncbi:MAG: TetR/AcrR family transcriptional regulator [Actinomycetota bacterium]
MTARTRLLQAADRLFYQEGIRTTGIDHLVAEAGVAKMTLYNQFGSKDGLVAAYLRARHDDWLRRLDTHLGKASSPIEEILAVFDAYIESASQPGHRGCAFLNAAAELPDRDHPARAVVAEDKESVRSLLREKAEAADLPDPGELAEQLFLLLEGGIVTAGVRGTPDPLRSARAAALSLLQARRR